ncbi:hypothetical protein Dip518_000298 [Parelusimicrobium proximum]|uniref:YggS family pyridoxal phosphate-dependent enzyme n=1 Tax=Parelusimicrobium proximum TaxID=3228953 RepID=UPI003D17957B
MILKNFADVNRKIESFCKSSGRDAGSITLLTVIKYASDEDAAIVLENNKGIHAAEGRVQDALSRWASPAFQALRPYVTLHFIGHLQKNKAAKAIELFDFIDSVDTKELAAVLSDKACTKKKRVKVLMQINPSNNPAQGGVSIKDAAELAEYIESLDGLELKGFMAIAPVKESKEDTRPYFRAVKEVFDKYFTGRTKGKYLSLGMSDDFDIALEEGSNMPRVGSAIFKK